MNENKGNLRKGIVLFQKLLKLGENPVFSSDGIEIRNLGIVCKSPFDSNSVSCKLIHFFKND